MTEYPTFTAAPMTDAECDAAAAALWAEYVADRDAVVTGDPTDTLTVECWIFDYGSVWTEIDATFPADLTDADVRDILEWTSAGRNAVVSTAAGDFTLTWVKRDVVTIERRRVVS
jgi:hypothetical protein